LDAEAAFVAANLASMVVVPTSLRRPAIAGRTEALDPVWTCAAGLWSADRDRSYSWSRDDVLVAAGQTYVPSDADRGSVIRCHETATNSVGSQAVASAPLVIPSIDATERPAGRPAVPAALTRTAPRVPRAVRVTLRGGIVTVRFARVAARYVVDMRVGTRTVRGRGPVLRLTRHGAAEVELRTFDRVAQRWSKAVRRRLATPRGALS